MDKCAKVESLVVHAGVLPLYTRRHFGIRLRNLETARLLAKGYEENTEDDLGIAKDFEAAENELDENCGK